MVGGGGPVGGLEQGPVLYIPLLPRLTPAKTTGRTHIKRRFERPKGCELLG